MAVKQPIPRAVVNSALRQATPCWSRCLKGSTNKLEKLWGSQKEAGRDDGVVESDMRLVGDELQAVVESRRRAGPIGE